MVLLESTSLPIGTVLPHFNLKDPQHNLFDSRKMIGENGILIKFTCNHCPYALAIWDRYIKLSEFAIDHGISVVAINPNIHPDYPDDSPEKMLEFILKKSIHFPYLVDQDQRVAKSYQAQCTPDIYLLRQDMSLFYHGQLDNNWQNESAVTTFDLHEAIQLLISNKPAPIQQYPSMGCSIKWLQ